MTIDPVIYVQVMFALTDVLSQWALALEPIPLQLGNPIPGPGDIADAIVAAFVGLITAILDAMFQTLVVGLVPLLQVVDPTGAEAAVEKWETTVRVSLLLFPLMITLGVLNMPWADPDKANPWRQGLRIVTVILLIGISKPAMSFAIDLTNATTQMFAPDIYEISFVTDPAHYGLATAFGDLTRLALMIVSYPFVLLAVFFGIAALVLRIAIIYYWFIVFPFMAVLWYWNWGIGKHLNRLASKHLRMGLIALLAGPIIAIVLTTGQVIIDGGIVTAASGGDGGGPARFWSQLALTVMIPFITVAVIVKTLTRAGKPIGLGKAYSMGTTSALVVGGAIAGAVAGGSIGAGTGALAGKTTSSLDGSGGGGGDGGSRSKPSGSSSNSGNAGGAHTEPDTNVAQGSLSDVLDDEGGALPGPTLDRTATQPRAGEASVMPSTIAQETRGVEQFGKNAADRARYLEMKKQEGKMKLGEADSLGILPEEPAQPTQWGNITDENMLEYQTASGEMQQVDIGEKIGNEMMKADRTGQDIEIPPNPDNMDATVKSTDQLDTPRDDSGPVATPTSPSPSTGEAGAHGTVAAPAGEAVSKPSQPSGSTETNWTGPVSKWAKVMTKAGVYGMADKPFAVAVGSNEFDDWDDDDQIDRPNKNLKANKVSPQNLSNGERFNVNEQVRVEKIHTDLDGPDEGIGAGNKRAQMATARGVESGERMELTNIGAGTDNPAFEEGDVVEMSDVKGYHRDAREEDVGVPADINGEFTHVTADTRTEIKKPDHQ